MKIISAVGTCARVSEPSAANYYSILDLIFRVFYSHFSQCDDRHVDFADHSPLGILTPHKESPPSAVNHLNVRNRGETLRPIFKCNISQEPRSPLKSRRSVLYFYRRNRHRLRHWTRSSCSSCCSRARDNSNGDTCYTWPHLRCALV